MPGLDGAEKDSGEGFGRKLERLRELGQIVGDADGAGSLRDLNDGRHARPADRQRARASEAPKSTVPAFTCCMPPPEPMDW